MLLPVTKFSLVDKSIPVAVVASINGTASLRLTLVSKSRQLIKIGAGELTLILICLISNIMYVYTTRSLDGLNSGRFVGYV